MQYLQCFYCKNWECYWLLADILHLTTNNISFIAKQTLLIYDLSKFIEGLFIHWTQNTIGEEHIYMILIEFLVKSFLIIPIW